ncbi:hypothetical protein BDN70DRAFT_899924 [Pholiota conissans]|uniref:Heterokaryon incompatibility domain-containing protein n=1 Tax=Pholiota conissans TaxID=109636 RepID=A0A9P5YR66_9AGAR|nr:hypothetical protein BDN70DRAFT_899924 [Pholiota conissans]
MLPSTIREHLEDPMDEDNLNAQSLEERFLPDSNNIDWNSDIIVSIYQPLALPSIFHRPRAPLLNLALKEMHYTIFNEFPIRVLAFDLQGSQVELVGRNELWKRISHKMECDFYEKFFIETNMELDSSVDETERAVQHFNLQYGRYAILSHAWIQDTPGEVTYADWERGIYNKESPGFQKLANFCRVAATDYGVTLGWMDTVCINKDSSSELDESIRSMFNWYSRARVCITYLGDTAAIHNMRSDIWFKRGWTLQELLAPQYLKFYNMGWERMNSDDFEHDLENVLLLKEICAATKIRADEFTKPLEEITIPRKMQWAARRRVTRAEDTAYSLMGLFGVSMSIAYGEGPERAFVRLVKEILTCSGHKALQLTNFGYGTLYPPEWHRQISSSYLIPTNPFQYLWAKDSFQFPRLTTPITLTHLGVHVSVLLIPGLLMSESPLWDNSSVLPNAAEVEFLLSNDEISQRTYLLLDASIYKKSSGRDAKIRDQGIIFFGVLNFFETPTAIRLPSENMCYAKLLTFTSSETDLERILSDTSQPRVLPTTQPTVFRLELADGAPSTIQRNHLEKQGMFLRKLYL